MKFAYEPLPHYTYASLRHVQWWRRATRSRRGLRSLVYGF